MDESQRNRSQTISSLFQVCPYLYPLLLSLTLSDSATEIVFSSDGNTLIVHCEDSTIQKWSIAEFIK